MDARRFWDRSKLLQIEDAWYRKYLISFFESKIKEDAGCGDRTSEKAIPKRAHAKAAIIVKEDCICCGVDEASFFLENRGFLVQKHCGNGTKIAPETTVLSLEGNARMILGLERTLLNVIQRMSGIATKTREIVSQANKASKRCFVLGTRKTILEYLDKKALSVGGGLTHRLSLSDGILIKNNHLRILGNDVQKAVLSAAKARIPVEIEVGTKTQALVAARTFEKAKKEGAILFDNMEPGQIKGAIAEIRTFAKWRILFEASGGISESNVKKYAGTGVDGISLGSLTHSPKACDFSLRIL